LFPGKIENVGVEIFGCQLKTSDIHWMERFLLPSSQG